MDISSLKRIEYKTYQSKNGEWEYFFSPKTADVSMVYYGDIRESKTGDFVEVPFCTYSDYSGGTVERSNHRVLIEKFKDCDGVWNVFGGYGTKAIIVSIESLQGNEELQDIIIGLQDYPCVDEEDWSNLEMEIEDEDWKSYRKEELTEKLEEKEIEFNPDTLLEDFRNVMEKMNEYMIFEDAVSSYVDLDKIVEHWQDKENE